MGYAERKIPFGKIEAHRQRPLIVYATSGRPGAVGIIASDAIREFIDQLHALPSGTNKLDLIVNSMGGDGLTSWRIISLIREKIGAKGHLSVLVPLYAYSAGTLMALGADDIYLHPFACLGPVDPQISVTTKEGQRKFAYEDLVAFAKFLNDEGKLTEQPHLANLLEPLVNEISPSILGASKRSSGQAVTMASRLLKMHMKDADAPKAEVIAEKLNKSFFSHGHAVSRTEARELGLKVAELDPVLDGHLWDVYLDLENEMKMKENFDPLSICLADPANAFLSSSPPTPNLPQNVPPNLLVQYWQQFFNQLQVNVCKEQPFDQVLAIVESNRAGSRFKRQGKVFAARKPDLDYIIGAPILSAGWETYPT